MGFQKRTLSKACAMSALPPKADIAARDRDVRFVPNSGVPYRGARDLADVRFTPAPWLFFARIGQELAQFIKQLAWLIGLAALRQHPFDLLIEAAIILLGLRHQPTVQLLGGPDGNGHAIRLLHHSLILPT
jgi:hypothetical protein